jgi:hypothetical protein
LNPRGRRSPPSRRNHLCLRCTNSSRSAYCPRRECTSNAQITEANRVYQSSIKAVNVFKAVEASLKKQLILAVPFTYIDELSDEEFGFANVTTLQILTHLDTTDDLETNLKHLAREWGTDQPIEDLWRQIQICRTFAAAHDPITELTAIRAAVTNLEKSNLFIDDVKQWRKCPDVEKTMANLKLDFNAADNQPLKPKSGDASTMPKTPPANAHP